MAPPVDLVAEPLRRSTLDLNRMGPHCHCLPIITINTNFLHMQNVNHGDGAQDVKVLWVLFKGNALFLTLTVTRMTEKYIPEMLIGSRYYGVAKGPTVATINEGT